MLNETSLKELAAIREKYPTGRAALLPAIYIAQRDFGWLSPEAIESVSQALSVPQTVVKGVATFYAMYKNKPSGRHLIQLCTNVSCMIFGAESLLEILKKEYGLQPGGTSPDGRFSLLIMECIGACDVAPAMLVNEDSHDNLTAESILRILERYK